MVDQDTRPVCSSLSIEALVCVRIHTEYLANAMVMVQMRSTALDKMRHGQLGREVSDGHEHSETECKLTGPSE